MKNLIACFFFLVTWNQKSLVWTNNPCIENVCLSIYIPPESRTYEVHVTTITQRLERQQDVDDFIGWEGVRDSSYVTSRGIIPAGAYNVRVEEIKP